MIPATTTACSLPTASTGSPTVPAVGAANTRAYGLHHRPLNARRRRNGVDQRHRIRQRRRDEGRVLRRRRAPNHRQTSPTPELGTTTFANGSHSLTAKAYDAALNVGTSPPSASPSTTPPAPNLRLDGDPGQRHRRLHHPGRHRDPRKRLRRHRPRSTKAAFQTFWGVTLASNVIYLTTPRLPAYQRQENYTLKKSSCTTITARTILTSSSANQSSAASIPAPPQASPPTGTSRDHTRQVWQRAGAGCAKGVVINEFSDAAATGNFVYEFVELHNDK